MEFDERDIFGCPVALDAPGRIRPAEEDMDSALACIPGPRAGTRIHALGPVPRRFGGKDSASHWTQATLKFRRGLRSTVTHH